MPYNPITENSPARGGQIGPGNLSEPKCLIDKALVGFGNGKLSKLPGARTTPTKNDGDE